MQASANIYLIISTLLKHVWAVTISSSMSFYINYRLGEIPELSVVEHVSLVTEH